LSTFGRMPPATRSESSWSCGAGSTCAMVNSPFRPPPGRQNLVKWWKHSKAVSRAPNDATSERFTAR
jgi:hypothetical protein